MGSKNSMPAASAATAKSRLSRQVIGQRSGTVVTERANEQFAVLDISGTNHGLTVAKAVA
jgi:hypothetical protein